MTHRHQSNDRQQRQQNLADSFRNHIPVQFLRGRFLNGSLPVRFLMVPESRFVSIRRLSVYRDYTVIGHYKDPYEPISIMESHKGFADDSEIRKNIWFV